RRADGRAGCLRQLTRTRYVLGRQLRAEADDDIGLVEVARRRGPALDHSPGRLGDRIELEARDARLSVAGLEWRKHARADGRELWRRRTHDHRHDVAAVRGLCLDQPPGTVDAEPDAISRHAELQLARHPRAEVAAIRGGGNEEHVRAPPLEHLLQRAGPDLRVVFVQIALHDAVRAVACELEGDVRAEDERDVVAAELP